MDKLILIKSEPGEAPAEPRPTYYSNLQNVLGAQTPDKPVHPDFIRNLMKQHQIGQEEQKWSGIHDILGEQQGKVMPGDILNRVRSRMPMLSETRYGHDPNEESQGYWTGRNAENHPIKWSGYNGKSLVGKGTKDNSEILMQTPEATTGPFQSGHWRGIPNVLAHIRLGSSEDAQGNPVTHINELQSDWHQDGRKRGYATPEELDSLREREGTAAANANNAMSHLNNDVRERLAQVPVDQSSFRIFLRNHLSNPLSIQSQANRDVLRHVGVPDELMQRAVDAMREHDAASDAMLDYSNRVPDAPFKTNWEKLAFKRALREAVDRGHDRVTWTTGQQQAERYNLGNWFHRLEYNPDQNALFAFPSNGAPGQHFEVPPNRLAEHVGAGVARQLLASPRSTPTGFERVENLPPESMRHILELPRRVRMGGEGMKGFYDHILPSYAKELVKRHGGEVGETKRVTGETKEKIEHAPNLAKHHQDVLRRLSDHDQYWRDVYGLPIKQRNQILRDQYSFEGRHGIGSGVSGGDPDAHVALARKYLPDAYPEDIVNQTRTTPSRKTTESSHYMTISPKLRESLLQEGIPLWGERNALSKCILRFFFPTTAILAKAS